MRATLLKFVLALLGGCCLTLSLAPFNWWPLAYVAPMALFVLLERVEAKQSTLIGLAFGLGTFLSGTHWVYVSIVHFSATPAIIGGILTLAFCTIMAAFYALLARGYHALFQGSVLAPLGFSALWIASDWLRSWLFTGFPWLYLGYGQIDQHLATWAPLVGIHGLSFALAFSASGLAWAVLRSANTTPKRSTNIYIACYIFGIIMLHSASLWLPKSPSVSNVAPLSVAIAQANIPQARKWDPEYLQYTLRTYVGLTEELWENDIILWPESAITIDYERGQGFLQALGGRASDNNSALITGIPYINEDYTRIHNSIAVIGQGSGLYHKQKLVPFGEFVPLQDILRGLIDFFDLPMSSFTPGNPDQDLLRVRDFELAPFICYELAYPDFVVDNLGSAQLIVTVSNDSWFGTSIAPAQHLQIAQFRALETSRYIVRATNNGISALIDPEGHITALTPQFEEAVISGQVWRRQGKTLFARYGSLPILGLAALILGFGALRRLIRHKP